MRAVVQRVNGASVQVNGETVGKIDGGLLVYLGVGQGDTEKDIRYMAAKVAGLRIFPDDRDHMNRSVVDVGGNALVVSQFTLFGDVRRGKRPSFTEAMEPTTADQFYERFCTALVALGVRVEKGIFGAMMDVYATNVGPVTILIDSEKRF